MSKGNKQTVEVYQNGGAKKYLETTKIHEQLDVEKAKRKQAKLNDYLLKSFSTLPKGASIFEIGCGDGVNAKVLKDSGYCVVASDVADAFIENAKQLGLETAKFNVLDDKFKKKVDGVLCWRVFVHFSDQDFVDAIKNIYAGLNEDGILVFNVFNRETSDVDEEMVDFNNEYKMGKERYYHYFRKEFVEEVIEKIGFEIQSFHMEGGDNSNKWFVYSLKKLGTK